MEADTVECNHNTYDLEAEIAKTAELIQKLSGAEKSINEKMNTVLEKQYKVCKQINRSRDKMLLQRRRICDLWSQIVSIEQYPYNMTHRFYHFPKFTTRRQRSPSPSTGELAKPIQKLSFEFRHKSKSLATERKMAREIQRCEKKEIDLTKPSETDTNVYFEPRGCRRGRPLPTKDVKELIRIWAEKVAHASILILRDSKDSIAPLETIDELLDEVTDFGWRFYEQMNISRAEFIQHWDSTKDVKNSIEHIMFDLNKARRRHETKVKELREKLSKVDERMAEVHVEMRVMRYRNSDARTYMWELQKKRIEDASHSGRNLKKIAKDMLYEL